jgi:hypothetical protein
MENITQAYSKIWLIKFKKERKGKCGNWIFFLREGGVRLGLVVEGEGGRPGFVMNLPVTKIPFSVKVSS